MNIVDDPSQAGYIVQANVLYMNYEKQELTADGMLAGGYGGAIAGALAGGRGWKGPAAGAVIGNAVGSLVGGAIGAAFKVGTFFGKEKPGSHQAFSFLIKNKINDFISSNT